MTSKVLQVIQIMQYFSPQVTRRFSLYFIRVEPKVIIM